MNYQQTLDYLFAALPMFSKLGASAYKKDLTNTLLLCDAIGNPQQKFKTIHVAGTNGKGSTSHMLAAILQTAGYKTGLYTSPHLKDFRERIKINGQVCEEDFVVDFTNRIQPLIKTIEPSFFEITVAMAFDYFAKHSVDIAIIEVGLGGRLDSTNIIVPELSIITNIGWDHMNLLGNSLELIAAEKAGIIKQNIPVVIGEIIPESKPIFEAKALELNAPIHWASAQRRVNDFEINGHLLQVTIALNSTNQRHQYQLDLCGHYQTKNLLTVLSAVTILQEQGWKIDDSTIQKALPNSKKINGLHGRWEIIQAHPLLVLDVGHNEDGIKQIVAQLALVAKAQVHIIIGMVKDKEIDTVLKLLPKEARYYFTKAQIPRALDQNILLEKAANYQLIGTSFAEVNEAIQSAKEHATKDDTIIVCGSVFLVGEVPYSSTTN